MRAAWILLLAVGVVAADIGLGYHYKVPQTTYGIPSYQFGGNSGQYSSAYSGLGSGGHSHSGYLGSGYDGTGYQGAGYQSGSGQSSSGLGSGYYQSSGASSSGNVLHPIYNYAGNSGLGSGYQTQYASSSQYQAADKYQQHYQFQHQPTQVFKHFYVHAAPEEPELPKPRAPIVLPPAQKHYKIIFVKAPSESHRSQAIIPVQPQNEEKTIVYVLVKKPEEHHEVVVPKIEQKPPSKPEVYFIKYKNKHDSQAVINNIVKDYNKGEHVSFNSGVGGSFSAGSGLSDTSYNTASGLSDTSYNTASGFGNVQYDAPAHSEVSSGSNSFGLSGTEGSAYSLSSANSGVDLNEANISSSISSPVTISSTASSIDYDSASAISTSQGIPHESYGPPKFRVN